MGMNSLKHVLKMAVEPYVAPELISPQHFGEIDAIARLFPNAITTFFGFESRLGEPDPRADFLFCSAAPLGRDLLSGKRSELPVRLMQQPVWKRVRQFAATWADPASALHQHVLNVWLEFDVDGQAAKGPTPSAFFGPGAVRSSDAYDWISDTAIPCLLGQALSAAVERRLHAAIAALPGAAYVFQIGLMLARGLDMVRICIRDIAPEQVLDYLRCMDWPGRTSELAPLLTTLSGLVDRIDLDLDVGDHIQPKLGLECYLLPAPEVRERLERFLDYLVESGLCLPAKRDAVAAYPGAVHELSQPAMWPPNLLQASQLMGPGIVSMFIRHFNHIKVVYHPEQPLEAKAYLGVRHIWLPRTYPLQPAIPALAAAGAAS